jgi:PAS domain S-box-containing protein
VTGSKLLASIVDSSDDAIIGNTLDGVITTWNSSTERIYGYRAEGIIGHSVSLLIPPGLPDEMDEILNRIRAGERVDHYETRRRRKDGVSTRRDEAVGT